MDKLKDLIGEDLSTDFIDQADKIRPKFEVEARCCSKKCGKVKTGRTKQVKKTEIFCPDCGYALIWCRVGKRFPY